MLYEGFAGPSYTSQSPLADAEELINWYVERIESPDGDTKTALYPTPGVQSFASVSQSPIMGTLQNAGRAFMVAGNTLYEVLSSGATTNRGAVALNGNPATLVTNGTSGQLMIVSGGVVQILNLTTNVLTTPAITGTATIGAMLDDFFIYLDTTTSIWYVSNVGDGTTWDPTQFQARNAQPDPWKTVLVVGPRLWFIGEQTTDVWYDAGTAPFPFQAVSGALIPYGTPAPYSAAVYQGAPVWLAQNMSGGRQVVRGTSFASAERISTHAMEWQISQYSSVSDAEAFTYQDQGHAFYVLTFPSANVTWVFDDEGGWHKRGTWNIAAMRYDAWHPRNHCYAFGKHLMGDRQSGTLYDVNVQYPLDAASGPIRRLRQTGGLFNRGDRVFFADFEVFLEAGLGAVSGQGSDPTIMLQSSNDGGKTFGNELWRSAGMRGQYSTRVRWARMGSSVLPRIDRLVVSDPIVNWRLLSASIDVRSSGRGAAA